MEGKFQTSFIPKKPIMASSKDRGSGMSLFLLLSIIIFTVSVALAVMVFVGQKYLLSEIEKNKQDFAKAKDAFDSLTIEKLARLDKRIESSKKILEGHTAVLPVFDYLEANTLKNIRFKSFELSFSEDNTVELVMSGQAKSFSAVALQSDVFSEDKNFKNPMVSDLDLTLEGGVIFNFKSNIDPQSLSYKNTRKLGENANNANNDSQELNPNL